MKPPPYPSGDCPLPPVPRGLGPEPGLKPSPGSFDAQSLPPFPPARPPSPIDPFPRALLLDKPENPPIGSGTV